MSIRKQVLMRAFWSELEKLANGPEPESTEGMSEEAKHQLSIARRRFGKIHRALKQYGVDTGAQMKRIAVPKAALSLKDIKNLGFVPVVVAVPEVGQKRLQSFRHPITNHHVHDHGDTWVIHEDKHPSTTMLYKKKELERESKLKDYRAPYVRHVKKKDVRVGSALNATVKGMPHLIGEGVPGLYNWSKASVLKLPTMKERVLAQTPKNIQRRFKRWKPSPTAEPTEPEIDAGVEDEQ